MIFPFNQHYLDLLWAMTEKEIKTRYKGAMLGFLWIILNPLLQMIIIGSIFSYFMKIPNYFIFLFSGLLPWQFFSMTLLKSTSSFINERSLVQKAVFPKEIIPLSIMFANAFNLILSQILLIIVVYLLHPTDPVSMWKLIPANLWIIAITAGCILLTASLTVRFRDVAFFVQTLTLLWFYSSPILYSLNQLPIHLQKLLQLNPLVYPLTLFQSSVNPTILVNHTLLLPNLFLTVILLISGVVIYRHESPYFVDWL